MKSRRPVLAALLIASIVVLAPAAARAEEAGVVTIDLGSGGNVELVRIAGGTFTRGSPSAEKGRVEDETQASVTLHDFYIGRTLVTRRQFAAFVVARTYRTDAERGASGGSGWDGKDLVQKKEFTWQNPGFAQTDDDPVTLVTYADAVAFNGWLSLKAGRTIGLPTEAQWEYAARAGTTTAFYSGEADEDALAIGWFKKNAGNGTRPVRQKTPNALGLYDMSGDVFQWCRDFYGPYEGLPSSDPVRDTAPVGQAGRRVLRGGSWWKDAAHGRSAARYRNTPGSRNADNGFRIASDDLAPARAVTPTLAPRLPPAPPPMPLTTTPTSSAPSGTGMAPLALLFGGGVVAAVLYLVFRKRGNAVGGAGAFRPSNVAVRVVEDGFWIEGGLPAGTRVKYTCTVRAVPVVDTIAVDGGGQGTFVYTGGVPERVQILEVTTIDDLDPPGGGGRMYRGVSPNRVYVGVPVRSDDPPAPAPFGGYPPAY